jgi:type IV fimbrial biogenesis protein FimT
MMAVGLLAITSAIALPNLRSLLESSKNSALASELAADLARARAEAVQRGQRVTVCALNGDDKCLNPAADWNLGWMLFSDINRDGDFDPGSGDELLKRRAAVADELSIVPSGFSSSGRIQFNPFGQADSQGSFLLCLAGQPEKRGRRISLGIPGTLSGANAVDCS